MDRQPLLDKELREVLQATEGYVNLYFQPPQSVQMKYNCIRYKRTSMNVKKANDRTYIGRHQYEIMAISRDPNSDLPRAIQERFLYCEPGRFFVADNLYHFPFTIYY